MSEICTSGTGRIIVVSGPSGVGKGTVLKKVLERTNLPLELSVSATTRAARPGEVHGVNYYFLSNEEFQKHRENHEFVECFQVFGGDWYGTLKQEVDTRLALMKWVVLEIDVQGGLAVQKIYPEAVLVFILPENENVLRKRLKGRKTESPEALAQRLDRAQEEVRFAGDYTYRIVNDDLEAAVEKFCKLLESL